MGEVEIVSTYQEQVNQKNRERADSDETLDEILSSQPESAEASADWLTVPDGTPLLAVAASKLEAGYGFESVSGDPPPPWRWPCFTSIDAGAARAVYRATELEDALAEVWTSDAHCVPYVVIGADGRPLAMQPRIKKDGLPALRSAGFDVRITAAVADVDNVPHVPWTVVTRADSAPKLKRLDGTAIWYESRKGLRVLRPYARWVTPEEHEGGVHAAFIEELKVLGLLPDPACRDWTRHYRLPFVCREGVDDRPARASFTSWTPFVPPQVKQPRPPAPVVRLRPATKRADGSPVVERARAYVTRIGVPACGTGTCDATLWRVALTAARGFDLDESDAVRLVTEWASRSSHREWSEEVFRRKVRDAARSTLEPGYLLAERHALKQEHLEVPSLVTEDISAALDAVTAEHDSSKGANDSEPAPTPEPTEDERLTEDFTVGRKEKAAEILKILRQLPFVRSRTGRVFARIRSELVGIDSITFRAKIAAVYHRASKGALVTADTIAQAALVISGERMPECDAPVRYARHAGAIYVDLADGTDRAVRISREGCEIVSCRKDGPAFLRPDGTLPIPTPLLPRSDEACRDALAPYRELLGVADDIWHGIVAWQLAVMRAKGPYPILNLRGERGSGKTGTGTLVASMIDPREPGAETLPTDVRDLAIMGEQSYVLFFDNISSLPLEVSDGLCRMATGAGLRTRKLHSDRDLTVFKVCRPVLLTSIVDAVKEPDLLDRAISLRLPRREGRKREERILADMESMRAAAFGALCYVASKALAGADAVRLERDAEDAIRMLDAAIFAAAGEEAAGLPPNAVVGVYTSSREDATAIGAEEPVVLALLSHVRAGETWSGQAQDLLDELDDARGRKKEPRGWPSSGKGMSSALRRLQPILRDLGVELVFPGGTSGGKGSAKRVLTITRAAGATTAVPLYIPPEIPTPGGDQFANILNSV